MHASFQLVLEGKLGVGAYIVSNLADIAAGMPAQEAQRPNHEINEAQKWQARAFTVARRIAIVEAHVWEHSVLEREPPQDDLEQKQQEHLENRIDRETAAHLEATGHQLHRRKERRSACSRCGRRTSRADHLRC